MTRKLSWPERHPRTPQSERKFGKFGSKEQGKWGIKKLTINEAIGRIHEEVTRLKADEMRLSTDLELRLDGWPRSGQPAPKDPGVALYFTLGGKERCIPCDTYRHVEDNMAAIAATISALRAIERHGSQMFEAAFQGFDALPAPDHVVMRNWRDVLDYYGADILEARSAYWGLRSAAHPDKAGGNAAAFDEVQRAWVQAQEDLK